MRFSDEFGVHKGPGDDWYDPLLNIDTALGIDPFLILTQRLRHFETADETIFEFFDSNFKLLAVSPGDKNAAAYKRAVMNLQLGEMEELCLGVTEAGTSGAGAGKDLSESLADGMAEAIELAVSDPKHFEEVSIFRNGFGLDRISDIVGHIILKHLVDYTREICVRHKIPMSPAHFVRGSYDKVTRAWTPLVTELPKNNYNGKSILLVPQRYLREDPTITADGFWRHSYYHHNDDLRQYFGDEIKAHADKDKILELARRRPEYVREYLDIVSESEPDPYDFDRDPGFVVRWDSIAKRYTESRALHFAISTEAEFLKATTAIVGEFKHFVEQNGGWELLYNDDGRPKHERAAQRLILGTTIHASRANNIDVSPESDIGRGPVDFKFSLGYAWRALVEVKLVSNTRFWSGLEKQLPTYLRANRVRNGFLIAVAFTDDEIKKAQDYRDRLLKVNHDNNLNIQFVLVDGRRPIPPSRL